jgi:hypothetical protein
MFKRITIISLLLIAFTSMAVYGQGWLGQRSALPQNRSLKLLYDKLEQNLPTEQALMYAYNLHNNLRVVYVDASNAGTEDGKTWATAYNTLTEGINQARYDPSTTDLDDDKNQHAYVFVAPGQYNKTSYTSFSGYGLHIIGVARGNGDYGVTVNYNGSCVGAPSVMVCGGAEIELANMTIVCDYAAPALYFTVGDYVTLRNIHIKGDSDSCTYGIQFDNAKHVTIHDCIIEGWETAGIYFNGGADQYFIYNEIFNNVIKADPGGTAGGVGILIDSDMTSYGSVIRDNFIDISGQGSGAIGIDQNSTSTTHSCFIVNNLVVGDASIVGLESTQRGMWNNAESANGTMTLDVDDD